MDTTRKTGPIAGPLMLRTNVLLPPEIVDWAKRQPGGLSKMVRRLLTDEWERASHATGTDGAELVLPTAEEIAAEEAFYQAWWHSLTPERQEQERAALARGFADSDAGRVIPAAQAFENARAYLRTFQPNDGLRG